MGSAASGRARDRRRPWRREHRDVAAGQQRTERPRQRLPQRRPVHHRLLLLAHTAGIPAAGPAELAAQAPPPVQLQLVDGVQQRLQQLGASFYRLERMGESGELFRFSCHMPWGADAAGERVFQAIEPSPELAMTQVLTEVEAWRR